MEDYQLLELRWFGEKLLGHIRGLDEDDRYVVQSIMTPKTREPRRPNNVLTDNERTVLRMRLEPVPRSYAKVGKELNYSLTRARQIHLSAITKVIRAAMLGEKTEDVQEFWERLPK